LMDTRQPGAPTPQYFKRLNVENEDFCITFILEL
jgi:hypothetical protein